MAIDYNDYIKKKKKNLTSSGARITNLGSSNKNQTAKKSSVNNLTTSNKATTSNARITNLGTSNKAQSFMQNNSTKSTDQLIDEYLAWQQQTFPEKKEEKKEKNWWEEVFTFGEFDDGYQLGDITKTILGTGTDLMQDISKGAMNVFEAPIDIATNIVATGANILGAEGTAEKLRDFADYDISEKLSRVTANLNPTGMLYNLVNGDPLASFNPDEADYEESSLMGKYADKTAELVGYGLSMVFTGQYLSGASGTASVGSKALGASANAGNIGVTVAGKTLNIPTLAITGGMSSGLQEANSKEGVTEVERWTKGITSGLIEGASEGLFGMFGVGGIKNEAGKEIFDFLGEKGAKAFSSSAGKMLATIGIKSAGEPIEEFVSYALNYLVDNKVIDKLGNADFSKEWDWGEVGEQMALAYASSLIMQGGGTTLQNNSAIAEAEKQMGRKLTPQEKALVTQASIEGTAEQKVGKIEQTNQQQTATVEEAPVQTQETTQPIDVNQEIENIDNQILELEEQLKITENDAEYEAITKQISELEDRANQLENGTYQQEIAPVQTASVEQISQPTTQQVETNLPTDAVSNTQNMGEIDKNSISEYNIAREGNINERQQINQEYSEQTTSENIDGRRSNSTSLETYWYDKRTIRKTKNGTRINDFKTEKGIVSTYEDTVPSVSYKDTYNIVKNAKSTNEYGAFDDLHEEAEYENMKNFSLVDGSGNISVKEDGDIVSVAKDPNSKIKGASKQLLLTALKNGGKKLDNYNGFLTINYQKAGFEPVARVKFNPEYAPDDWNFERDGQPDIIVMKHNGDSVETVEENYGKYPFIDIETLPYMEYDEAIAYRNSLIEEAESGTQTQEDETGDYGYHYGDLGKGRDTYYWNINSSRRSTGHYGTGTYFVSQEEADRMENSPFFSRKDRTKNKIDFSDYNLYKPMIESEARRLHDGLKAINYGEYNSFEVEIMKDDFKRHGVTEEEINKALEKVETTKKEYKSKGYDDDYQGNHDSLSTVFMKELGFEGIDVRGLEGFDNTSYGSVIYDLKNTQQETEIKTHEEDIAPIRQELAEMTKELVKTVKDTTKEVTKLKKELNEVKESVSEIVEEGKALTEADLPFIEQIRKEAPNQDIAPIRNNLTEAESQELDTLEDIPFDLTAEERARKSELEMTENNRYYMNDTMTLDKKSLKALSKNIKDALDLNNKQRAELENAIQEYSMQENASKEDLYDIIEHKFGKQSVEIQLEDVERVQRAIKKTKIRPTDDLRQMTDYFQTKQKNFGRITLSNEGMEIDRVYQELSDEYRDFFPDTITNPADQFDRIIEVANMEKTLTEDIILPEETIQDITDFVYGSVQDYKYAEYVKDSNQMYEDGWENLNIPYEVTSEEVNTQPKLTKDDNFTPNAEPLLEYLQNVEKRRQEREARREALKQESKRIKQQAKLEDTTPMREATKWEQAKTTLKNLFTNNRAVYDEIAKETNNQQIKYKADRLNTISGETADIITNQLDNNFNPVGKSLNAIFENAENQGLGEAGQDFLYHLSNINRHKRDKGSALYSLADSQKFVNGFRAKYPELANQLQTDVQNWNKNKRNNLVDAGLIKPETVGLFEELDIDYVPFHIIKDYTPAYQDVGEIKTRPVVKRAIGGSRQVLPIKEAMIKQLMSEKRAIAENDLYKEVIKTYGKTTELGADVRTKATDMSETLYADSNGDKYLTAYIGGERKSMKISDYLYDNIRQTENAENLIRATEEQLSFIFKPLQAFSSYVRNIHTSWSLTFWITNSLKDIQDAPLNSKDAVKFVKNYKSSYTDVGYAGKLTDIANNFKKETGQNITDIEDTSELSDKAKNLYQNYQDGMLWNKFVAGYGSVKLYGDTYNNMEQVIAKETQNTNSKFKKMTSKLTNVNEFMELATRYAEFKTSIENGASLSEAFYNAKDVSTNFGRGGVITKALNRNGATFLNASVQGFSKFVRNFSGENGAKGVVGSIAKAITLGVIPAIFNHLAFGGDDEDYEALPDYIKDNYYLIKTDDGEFIRIPKGRALSVFGSASRRALEYADGEKDAFEGYLNNAMSQSAPNNFLESNVFSPITQAINNETWYGGDLVPTRLQDKPVAEQYDESTDSFSKWLGQALNISPYKINYVIDQYSGGIGDFILPYMTEEAQNNGTFLAPLSDKFTVNSTMDNKYAGEFYDKMGELEVIANGENATEEDQLRSEYMSAVSWEMSDLYKEKRTIQNDSSLSKAEKYEKVKAIQAEINAIAQNALSTYDTGTFTENYAEIGDYQFNKYINQNGEEAWGTLFEDEAEELKGLGLTSQEYNDYFAMKMEFTALNDEYYKQKDEIEAKYDKFSDEYDIANDELYWQKKTTIIDKIMNSNFSDDTKAYVYNKYYSSDKIDVISKAGIDIDYLLDYEKNDFQADYNYKGKAITNSRKNKVINYVNDYDLSIAEKAIIIKANNSFKFNEYNYEIVDYVDNLDIPYEEKVYILKSLGMKVSNDGKTISW